MRSFSHFSTLHASHPIESSSKTSLQLLLSSHVIPKKLTHLLSQITISIHVHHPPLFEASQALHHSLRQYLISSFGLTSRIVGKLLGCPLEDILALYFPHSCIEPLVLLYSFPSYVNVVLSSCQIEYEKWPFKSLPLPRS